MDTPQREPGRSERHDAPNVIFVIVFGRERRCAEYKGGHAGQRSVVAGGPEVGRLK